MNPFFSIIIPAHNEQNRLPGTLDQILQFLQQQTFTSEVIVVENGSADRTYEIAHQFAKEHANLYVTQSEKGKGAAVLGGKEEIRRMALDDPDLEPLWKEIKENRSVWRSER